MSKTTLQVPLDTDLRDRASIVAFDLGFSSLQEAVRVYLKQLSDRKIGITIIREPEVEFLTPSQEEALAKTKIKVDSDVKSGNFIVATTVKEAMDFLND